MSHTPAPVHSCYCKSFLIRHGPRVALALGCALPVGLIASCQQQDETIAHYKAPHAVQVDDDAQAEAEAKVRLLAAMAPHAGRTWFFKVQGPADVVSRHKQEFDHFLASIHFTDNGGEPMTWTAPAGWVRESAGNPERYATFRIGSKDDATQLTVTSFPGQVGTLLANVNRWRRQIGLGPTVADRLPKYVNDIKIDGSAAQLVSLAGPGGNASGGMMAPFMQGHPPIGDRHPPVADHSAPPAASALHYQMPDGWQELPSGGAFAFKKFRVGSGEATAEVSITPLGGMAGGLLANVNRWRSQLELGPVDDAQLGKLVHEIQVDGQPASYVDLAGKTDRMLVVIVKREDVTWFVKMLGPKDLVGQQKSAFESFARSLRFGAGDNHE